MTDALLKRIEAAKPWSIAPVVVGLSVAAAAAVWLSVDLKKPLILRVPGTDQPPSAAAGSGGNPVLAGTLTRGAGKPMDLRGGWPGFRGPDRNGISPDTKPLARSWDSSGPRELWSVQLGEGYAGAAVWNGRVYVMDYDQEKKRDALRCLSFADGQELWRYSYPVRVKRYHGMSRTVPAVNDRCAVAMGPKCHVVCVDATSGDRKWGLDLVRQFGATVPQWYAGQCPLIDGQSVILAPGGTNALLIAVEIESGKVIWSTPNPNRWKMTHSSIVPMDFAGKRQYVYCASRGVVGVSATDGAILWETADWKIAIATVPSPLILDEGRIFLSGGYDSGSLMLQLREEAGKLVPRTLFKLAPGTFGAAQHTPVFSGGYIYGVRPDNTFACLGLDGKVVWSSGPNESFGLGPFLLAGRLIFAMNDKGKLTLMDATPAKYTPLAKAHVLKGRESWGPMALVDGRLLARDLTRMVCLDVAAK